MPVLLHYVLEASGDWPSRTEIMWAVLRPYEVYIVGSAALHQPCRLTYSVSPTPRHLLRVTYSVSPLLSYLG